MKVLTKISVNNGENNKSKNPHLRPQTIYVVVGLDDENFRILNDVNEPALYSKDLFEVIDPNIPKDWIRIDSAGGEYHINPQEFSKPGFYEDYFDGVAEAVKTFHSYLVSNGINNKSQANHH